MVVVVAGIGLGLALLLSNGDSQEEEHLEMLDTVRRILTEVPLIDGDSSENRKYPFLVSLQTKNLSLHMCSGVLLTNKKVLTTCICVMTKTMTELGTTFTILRPPKDYVVRAGQTVSREVRRFYHHDNCSFYDNATWIYNYGFAELTREFPILRTVNPIKIYSTKQTTLMRALYIITVKSGVCFFAGLRKTEQLVPVNNGSSFSLKSNLILTEHRVKLIPLDACSHLLCNWNSTFCSYRWTMHGQGCGFVTYPVTKDCKVDQGSALVCIAPRKRKFVWGITSWQSDCSDKDVPIVFSKIDFILSEFVQSFASQKLDFQLMFTLLMYILIVKFLLNI